MLRDVFYYGLKPNVHPREKPAINLEDARQQSTTEHFWIINEFCDYSNFDWDFDFDFLPDNEVWTQDHINVWPSQHCKDSDTWLCPKTFSDTFIYRENVDVIKRKSIRTDNWVINEKINEQLFDFSWHPDPTSPAYIYKWGCRFYPSTYKAVIEYHVKGATNVKHMDKMVELLPDWEKWHILHDIDKNSFDFTWRPDPSSPPYIYVWGNQHYSGEIMPTVEYHVDGALERKYIDKIWHAKLLPQPNKFEVYEALVDFDYTWVPDPTSPPYIYIWGNQWNKPEDKASVIFRVDGATEYKYIDKHVTRLTDKSNWIIPNKIDDAGFDYSWEPNPNDPPYIYVFGTQHQKTGGPKYVVDKATEFKYMSFMQVKNLPDINKFTAIPDIDVIQFDYSWHPDENEQPYIYVFGNEHYDAEIMPTLKYVVDGATDIKYINTVKAKIAIKSERWKANDNIDLRKFNFDWIPNPKDPLYIYEFGTQHQKTGGPRYIVPGATEVKFVTDQVATALPTSKNWKIVEGINIKEFDYSWHPDSTEKPYIYVFGNQYYSAEIMPTVEYHTPGATEIKYIPNIVATISNKREYWVVPDNITADNFDYDWIPNPHDPPYIYEFNTQWQKNGGIKFVMPGATELKYMTSDKIKALPTIENWMIEPSVKIKSFDYSWHPDNTEKPYIYVFGNNQYPAEIMPTVRYVVPGATEIKFIKDIVAVLDINMDNWTVPDNIDISRFDFSWVPDPTSPPYVYEFATVWNDRGGPVYTVPNATEKKYNTDICAKLKPNKLNWHVNIRIDPNSFDFSWVPHPEAPPYIYVFGNQWNIAERESTLEYRVPGATEYKYVNNITAKVVKDKSKFKILIPIIENEFDFSWRPDPYDQPYIYVFGNTQYPGEIMPTVRYNVPGATVEKHIDIIKAKLAPNIKNWVEKLPIDKNKFDFAWVPDPKAPPYIYVFGSQWNAGIFEHALEYVVPGAIEYKYIDDIVAYILPNKKNFKILHPIVEDSFDFSWRPNPKDPAYIYVFGNTQYAAEKMPTIEYHVSGATEYKYMDNLKAVLAQNYEKFHELIPIDKTSFDYSWTPDPHDPPYIYVWGNQWHGPEIEPTIEYRVPGATERKFMQARPRVLPDFDNWKELITVKRNFDFSWRPDPTSPAYIYVFGNQWHKAEIEPTLEYHVKGATDRKYVKDIIAEVVSDKTNWLTKNGINIDDFDFSWRPDPGAPPYIYQFGTLMDDNDGPMYVHPKNNGEVVRLLRVNKKEDDFVEVPKYYIQTTLEDLIEQHDDKLFWALNKNINYSNFNFNWRPSIEQARFVHVFGSPDAVETQTYFVNSKLYKQGFTQLNFVTEDIKADNEYLAELFIQPDIFMIDRGNIESKERFEKLKERFPTIQKARYLNGWVDTIYRCLNKCKTDLAWILNSELDYTDFDFKYYPNPWQLKMVHVFGTQWSHWGTTYLVNKNTFIEDTKYIKIIEHLSNLNFVKNRVAKATNCLYDVFLIDHGNIETETIKQQLSTKAYGKNVTIIPYRQSYLQTFKDILSELQVTKNQYIWVCSSVCDYNNFDLTYICDPFAKDNLHVFSSDKQKFGDTFLIDVNKLSSLINNINLLEDYEKVNYNQHLKAKRLPAPEITIAEDTHSKFNQEFDFPYAIVKTQDNIDLITDYTEPLCLWADHTKNIEILSTGGTVLVLPKEVKMYHNHDLYDYPYITKSKRLAKSNQLDIVFLSNGEKYADENYEHLLKICKHLPNRIVRVDGINGRVNAYHKAAEASNTPWMFTVFAKLKVNDKFDFNWQPDRLQVPKHYIFNALNPVNKLVYGHQAMIAYNKKLVLNNTGKGLDFTLDDEHEVVDMLSGIANFNTDRFSAWRTAFREVIKLKSDYKDISFERLNTWLTVAEGDFAEDCLQGAKDGVAFYDQVKGDPDQLKLSYEWVWLKSYYDERHK